MDIRYFLKERIDFVRQLYDTCAAPYIERKQLIEARKEPFVPPYSEDAEPAFLDEWIEAEESLQFLGRACLSMLAASFKLYFVEWVAQLGVPVDNGLKKTAFKPGWFHGYKAYFAQHFNIRFENSPANLAILEEIVLVRNNTEHPASITLQTPRYVKKDLEKLRHPFFMDDYERNVLAAAEADGFSLLMPPRIHVSKEELSAALSEVEKFAQWLETTDHPGLTPSNRST